MLRTLLIGNTGGLGLALHAALEARGEEVLGLSRSRDGLDFQNPENAEAKLNALEPHFDRILVTVGQLAPPDAKPERRLRELEAQAMTHLFAVNTIGPALVLKQAPRLLPRDRPSQIAVLSARVGSIGDNQLGGWYTYRASKAALNQVLRSAALELKRTHPLSLALALHPGTLDTSFTEAYPRADKLSPSDSASRLLDLLDSQGPEQSGSFMDWQGKTVPW